MKSSITSHCSYNANKLNLVSIDTTTKTKQKFRRLLIIYLNYNYNYTQYICMYTVKEKCLPTPL